MSYQNRLVRTKIIPRFSVIFKFFRNFVFLDVFASLCFLCAYIFHVISRALLGASGTRGCRRGVRPAQMRSSAACFAEISPEVILRDGVRNRAIFVRYKIYTPYGPTVAPISNRISALGSTLALIHFTLCIVRHIDQSKPVEHSVDIGYAPDIAQRFWTVNHRSDLFYIAQCQQHRTPRQTFAVFPAVDPEFFCVFAVSAFSYFIREWQAGIGFKTHFLIHQNDFPQLFLCRRCSQLFHCSVQSL